MTPIDDDWKPHVRALLYPVIFSANLADEIDRVAKIIADQRGASPAAYRDAIARALASDERVAEVLDLDQPEAAVREFLRAVGDRLAVG
jgi:hypothetical protein